jgi:hypothetical protein
MRLCCSSQEITYQTMITCTLSPLAYWLKDGAPPWQWRTAFILKSGRVKVKQVAYHVLARQVLSTYGWGIVACRYWWLAVQTRPLRFRSTSKPRSLRTPILIARNHEYYRQVHESTTILQTPDTSTCKISDSINRLMRDDHDFRHLQVFYRSNTVFSIVGIFISSKVHG